MCNNRIWLSIGAKRVDIPGKSHAQNQDPHHGTCKVGSALLYSYINNATGTFLSSKQPHMGLQTRSTFSDDTAAPRNESRQTSDLLTVSVHNIGSLVSTKL